MRSGRDDDRGAPGVKKALAIAAKDLRSDARAKDVAPTMALFALTLVFVVSFAIPPGGGRAPLPGPQAGAVAVREILAIFMWSCLLFAAIIGFGRSAAAEMDDGRIDALILAPVDPAAVFIGKTIGNLVFLLIAEAVVIPALILLTGLPAARLFPGIIAVTIAADLGLVAVGTLFGTASQYARARSLILPLLCFPVMLPAVLAASRLTASLMSFGSFAGEGRWFILLCIYDVVLIAIATVTFEFVIKE